MPLTFSRTLTDEELFCLKNDLLDVEAWINAAIDGKVNKCHERLTRPWIDKLRSEGTTIPAEDTTLLNIIKTHPDYQDRATREAPPPEPAERE